MADVRMRGFQQRTDVTRVLALLDERVAPLGPEAVELTHAAGPVLAADVVAGVAVPRLRPRGDGRLRPARRARPSAPTPYNAARVRRRRRGRCRGGRSPATSARARRCAS